jgi:hypothetical protein
MAVSAGAVRARAGGCELVRLRCVDLCGLKSCQDATVLPFARGNGEAVGGETEQ